MTNKEKTPQRECQDLLAFHQNKEGKINLKHTYNFLVGNAR